MRITPDEPRLPITIAQAEMGVDWDTADTPPGTWIVATYTWEPEQNLWSHRFAAVRIVDSADAGATGPTVFLQRDEPIVRVGDAYVPPGCVDAPAGSTITGSWGLFASGMEPQWVTFAQDVPAQTGALALQFVPPAEAAGNVKLRFQITDRTGRSYVAYSPAFIGVLGAAGEDGAQDDGGDESSEDEGGAGGGCRVHGPQHPGALVLLACVAAGLWRRRAHPAPRHRRAETPDIRTATRSKRRECG